MTLDLGVQFVQIEPTRDDDLETLDMAMTTKRSEFLTSKLIIKTYFSNYIFKYFDLKLY